MPIASNLISHAEITVKGVIAGGGSNAVNTVNVFHYRRTAVVNPLSKANLDAVFQANVVVPWAGALNARWLQVANTVRWIDDVTDVPTSFAHALPGGVAGESMPPQISIFILQQTGLRGKSYRGGKKVGPISEGDTTTPNFDVLNAAAIARFLTLTIALQAAITDLNPNTWVPQVFSRTLSQVKVNPTTVVSNDVITTLTNKRLGRLKKREVKSVY